MVITLGVLTVLLAGWRAIREYDLKLILAFGTVSQLGLITVMVGAGGSDLMLAGLALLCAHAMFKAALFMVVGIIDHTTGTRDIRRLAWLGQRSKPLLVIAVGATASMAALPPFLGFVAKEADYETLLHSEALGHFAPFVLARHRRRLRVHHHLQPAFPVGCLRAKGQARTQQARRGDARLRLHVPGRACGPRRGRPGVRAVARRRSTMRWTPTPTRSPAKATTTSRCGTASTCRCCCRCWCWRSAPRHSSAGPVARTRLSYLPLGNADRIYDAVIRGADVLSVRLTGTTQRGSIPATQSVILSTLASRARGGAGARGARPARVRAVGLADSGGRRRADAGRRGRCDRHAQPSGRRAAGRCDRLRLRHHLRVPRRTRPGADPVSGGDADAGHLRAGAADAARRVRPRRHPQAPAAACGAGAGRRRQRHHTRGVRDGGPHRCPDRRAAARRRVLPRHTAPTPSTCCWSTSGPGTPSARSRCCWSPRPAWRQWCSGTVVLAPHRASPTLVSPTSVQIDAIATSPAAGDITWLRGSELRDPTAPIAGAGGRHPDDLPAHHGAVGVLLLRRPQHTRRRLRGRADRRSRAGAAVPRGRSLRTRRDAAAGRRQDPRHRPCAVGGHRGGVAAARRTGAVVGGAAVRHSGAGPHQARHCVVLRPRRVSDRRRPGARRAAQPRRAGGRRDGRAAIRRR